MLSKNLQGNMVRLMANKNWTLSQNNAINAKGGTILVSAAAGSGKTAVLVQRVIEKITNKENPIDADRLLIVTFTNAAASEMKERISASLSDLISNDPTNMRLQRQKILITTAHISTIHSFCNEIIKENFYKLSISPDFKIADSNEMTILRNDAVQNVIDEFYSKDDKLFYNLVESFSSAKNDVILETAIYSLYDFLRSHPFPEKWLSEKQQMYKEANNISLTIWAETLFKYANSAIEHCISITNLSLKLITEDSDIFQCYNEAFVSDLNMFLSIKESIDTKNWDELHFKIKTFDFIKLKPLRGYSDDQLKEKILDNRKMLKSIRDKLLKYFYSNQNNSLEDIKTLKPIIDKFFEVVWSFWTELDKLKREKNIVDFGDLEHFALKLLAQKTDDGFKKTDYAISISNKFDEVLVDEYQDTNEAQDIIFRAISKDEKNLFIVGDVKQSVYGFRQAMPEIFLKRKQIYNLYVNEENNFPAKIILDKNFRSRKGITDSVNFIFKQLMSEEIGDMYYQEEEELKSGASYPKKDEPTTEINIIDLTDCEEGMDITEARHIASIITHKIFSGEMVYDNGELRPVTYRDFCILIRNANKHASIYAKELNLCGVPAWSDTAGDFFGTIEISTMLSMLRVIDNPIQDVAVLSVLVSPIFGFTAEKLSDIRLIDKKLPIYLALKKCADNEDQECKYFIEEIDNYRRIASTISSDELIEYIYEKTSFTSLIQAMNGAEMRLANLRLLSNYAKNYESYGYRGLPGFIRFIDKLELQKSDLTPASTISEASNVVKIMSIHRSKGLEFPICIVAGCSKRFNKRQDSVLLHHNLGLGIKIKDPNNMTQYSSMPREAVLVEMERAYMSEELRVLYVALTRAKETLIMIISLKNPEKTLMKLALNLTENPLIAPYNVRGTSSFSDLILSCALRHPDGKFLRQLSKSLGDIILPSDATWKINLITPQKENEKNINKEIKSYEYDDELLKKINHRINFKYSLSSLNNIPTKVSASEIYKEDTLEETHLLNKGKVPAFILGEDATASQKGIALHLFLEFADYKEASLNLFNHIEELVSKKFISKQQQQSLNTDKLEKFFKSNLMKRIINSKEYVRELRFTVEYDEQIIKSELVKEIGNELVVLQGAVDCVFIEDNNAVIVDYKTNAFLDENEYIKKYKDQLTLYKYAISKSLNMQVKECIIYSFSMGKEVLIK